MPHSRTIVTPLNPFWADHILGGIAPFRGRAISSLSYSELALIRDRWLPTALQRWDQATPEQQADCHALINALRALEDKLGKEPP